MKPTKAYILHIDSKISKEYAQTAAASCQAIDLPFELFRGYQEADIKDLNLEKIFKNVKFTKPPQFKGKAGAATLGHFLLWDKIVTNKECAIILEHDALMLRKVEIDIPDKVLVALGYKVYDPPSYNHKEVAKQEQRLHGRKKHGGAHAYTMNHNTAHMLLQGMSGGGNLGYIDNSFFLGDRNRKKVGLQIIDPICSLGWLRESTIWKDSAVDNHRPILDSFTNNYKSKKNLGIKG
jgi:hypothetical protein